MPIKRKNRPVIAVNSLNLYFRNAAAGVLIIAFIFVAGCATNKNLEPKQEAGIGRSGFDEADANHDGKLSKDEASDFLVNEIFASRDANHDGRMTAQEWAANEPGRLADFKKRDTNHDGVVTKEERYLHDLHERIRDVQQGPDGYVYVITDNAMGRILRVLPAR